MNDLAELDLPAPSTGARQPIVIALPWPPSVNHYWKTSVIHGRIRVRLSEDGERFRRIVKQTAMSADLMHRMQGRLMVRLDCYPPDNRTRDLDNLPKGILDALTESHVWRDDSQVDALLVFRGHVVRGGAVRVTIKTVR